MTTHATKWEQLFATDVTDKGVISRMHKKYLQIDKNENTQKGTS